MKSIILSLLLSVSVCATAAEYKIITPNSAASGGSDLVARRLSDLYQKKTGNALVVVNASGGNHVVAANAFKQESTHAIAAVTPTSTMMVYNHLESLPYQDSDFNIIALMGPRTWLVHCRDLTNLSSDRTPPVPWSTSMHFASFLTLLLPQLIIKIPQM